MTYSSFQAFFEQATGDRPFPYQRALADDPRFPDMVAAPTGAGNTAAAVLGWLWRRREVTDDSDTGDTPLVRPVIAHATIGILQRWIFKTSDPQRFELDVVICRKGDQERRQQQRTAGLASCCKEE